MMERFHNRQEASFASNARHLIDDEPGRDVDDLERARAVVPEELDVVFISGMRVERDDPTATAQHRDDTEGTAWTLERQNPDGLLAGANGRGPSARFQCRSPEFNTKEIEDYEWIGLRLFQMDHSGIVRRDRRTAGSDQDQQSAETSTHGRLPHNVGLIADEQLGNNTLPDDTAGFGNGHAQIACIMSAPIIGAAFLR